MTQLLTVPEVAQRLRVHPATVRRLVLAGDLPCVRIRRAVRISETALGEYLWRSSSGMADGSSSSCTAGEESTDACQPVAGKVKPKPSKLDYDTTSFILSSLAGKPTLISKR